VLIRIWIERAEPLAGAAAIEGTEPRAFDGWLELLGVIAELVTAAAPHGGGGEHTDAETPIQDGWMIEDR
jgi:hypothetical protein